jgi:hypothetical protein
MHIRRPNSETERHTRSEWRHKVKPFRAAIVETRRLHNLALLLRLFNQTVTLNKLHLFNMKPWPSCSSGVIFRILTQPDPARSLYPLPDEFS